MTFLELIIESFSKVTEDKYQAIMEGYIKNQQESNPFCPPLNSTLSGDPIILCLHSTDDYLKGKGEDEARMHICELKVREITKLDGKCDTTAEEFFNQPA
jgi:hypothetical protein